MHRYRCHSCYSLLLRPTDFCPSSESERHIISSARVITQVDINYYPRNVYVFSFITRISNQYRNIIESNSYKNVM